MNFATRSETAVVFMLAIGLLAYTHAFQNNGECRTHENYCGLTFQQNLNCHCCKNELYNNMLFVCEPVVFGTQIDALGHRLTKAAPSTCQSSDAYCNKQTGATYLDTVAGTNPLCHCCQNEYIGSLTHFLETDNVFLRKLPCEPCLGNYYETAEFHRLSYCSSTSPSQTCRNSNYESCKWCGNTGGYIRANYSSYLQCRRCASKGLLKNSDPNWSCVPWCKKGEYLDYDGVYVADCLLCPAGKYQDEDNHRLMTCKSCPFNSDSQVASTSWTSCKCNNGFKQEFVVDPSGLQIDFNCYCDPGYYVNGSACIRCGTCAPGQYRQGCGKYNSGVCVMCAGCASPSHQRAGCGYLSEGECKDKTELVRMPFCPVSEQTNAAMQELAVSVRQASGLGAFSFQQVFGTDAEGADFICSKPCDGVTYDSIQCDGPFACNVKTCAELTRPNELPRACPVVIEAMELQLSAKSVRDRKRRESCVECNRCGLVNDFFADGESKSNYYDNWGGGCVRECSKLMCSDNTIWDWTRSSCQQCSELRDVRLCSKRDRLALGLETKAVTGNWPLLYFPECEGQSANKQLQTLKYGICAVCDHAVDKSQICLSPSQYPAACVDTQVECQQCHRAGKLGTAQIVDVFKGWWFNSNSDAFEHLHCQISACRDKALTTVGAADRMCTQPCSVMTCNAREILIPCRLPHDARCEFMFPDTPLGHPEGLQQDDGEKYADGEVNLLNEVNDFKHRRFASFENTLIVLGNPEFEYQCVWNAEGIFDSKATPAGVSNVLWLPGVSDDDAFKQRGTQVCRPWDVASGVTLPLLPLQNTISASQEQESLPASSRRMLVDTEAYVLSYRFHGSFSASETVDVRGAFTDAEHNPGADMLRGSHIGGAGRLFLMLRMHASQATVAVTMPSDRKLHEASWVQSLMISFAVVDLTKYNARQTSEIFVSASVTAGEKLINDQADNFVLESFWVQNLLEPLSSSPLPSTIPACVDDDNYVYKEIDMRPISTVNYKDGACVNYRTFLPSGQCLLDHGIDRYAGGTSSAYGQMQVCSKCARTCYDACCYGNPATSPLGQNYCAPCVLVPSQPFLIGDNNSRFLLEVVDEAFNNWTKCSTSDMLALAVLNLQIAPFYSQPTLTNYSWIKQQDGVAIPFNVSVSCMKNAEIFPATICQSVQDNAVVYVRTQPYTFLPEADATCALCGGNCSLCTEDRCLRGLLHVMQHVNAVRADQHGSGAGLMRYLLDTISYPLELLQAHAMSPFGQCVVLLTTRNASHDAVMCIGFNTVRELASTKTDGADHYFAAFPHFINNIRHTILLLKGRTVRSVKLVLLDETAQTTRIINSNVQSANWVSVFATATPTSSQIVALCLNSNNQLEVRFYILQGEELTLQARESVLEVTYQVVEETSSVENSTTSFLSIDPWLSYSRIAVCTQDACSGVFLAAAVKRAQMEASATSEGGPRLFLTLCSGSQTADTTCANTTLPLPADSTPSFISVAFLRVSSNTQHWVVGVFGITIAVSTSDDNRQINIQLQQQSQLRNRHFIKVDPLFYTLDVDVQSGRSDAESGEIMTYLKDFYSVLANTSLPAVYGVVVVPPSRSRDQLQLIVDENAAPQPYWQLQMHTSSYMVESPGSPGLVVYERTGPLASNDEFEELRVSKHTPSPFSSKKASFVATYEGSSLNRRIALPNAYGRYTLQNSKCVFMHAKPASSSGIKMLLRQKINDAQPWLLLQFKIECNATLAFTCSELRPQYWRHATRFDVQPTPENEGEKLKLNNLRCPLAEVIVVMHSALTKATVYQLQPAQDSIKIQSLAVVPECIFLGQGVSWVNSVAFATEPSSHEVRRRLLRGAELMHAPVVVAPISSSWRRERIVATLNPVENMRVELTIKRDARLMHATSVGVDDVQIAAVLSSFPSLLSDGVLCAVINMPTVANLQTVGLASLIVNTTWTRVHVTVSLQRFANTEACEYQVRLYNDVSADCPSFTAQPSGIERIGCRLLSDATNVRGSYAECQVEVPLDTANVGVAVQAVNQEVGCLLGANDSLVAWLRPYTALYSCPTGQFRDAAGACINCHDTEALVAGCPLGQRLSGCPALLQAPSRCEKCVAGSEAVATGVADWVTSNASICAWRCKANFFRLGDACIPCSTQQQECAAGQRWQACDAQQDARCVACPDLRLTMGTYASNAEYYDACQTRCREGCYNDTTELADGRCKRCWDSRELALHASREVRFFALFNCSATSNARWAPCAEEVGAQVVGSDPGADSTFTGRCVMKCRPGWRKRNPEEPGTSTCVQCEHPRRVQLGNITQLPLETHAFNWLPESCSISCIDPWLSTRARNAPEDTCVICEAEDGGYLCPDGQFPTGPYCACQSCEL